MKLAISNIAWQFNEEHAVAELLRDLKVRGVEIAPTKIWDAPLEASDSDIKDYREFWTSHGIEIVAMQALLFGKPDLTIFESESKRRKTLEYVSEIIQLGRKLGAGPLVFGSPKNRIAGALPKEEINRITVPFFHKLGELAAKSNVILCIEPNPIEYGCDFVTTAEDGLDLVERVDSRGFRLHLDAAGMTLSEDMVPSVIAKSIPWLSHFHISEPYLAHIGSGAVEHGKFAAALRHAEYKDWVSIEMRSQSTDSCLESVADAVMHAQRHYGELLRNA